MSKARLVNCQAFWPHKYWKKIDLFLIERMTNGPGVHNSKKKVIMTLQICNFGLFEHIIRAKIQSGPFFQAPRKVFDLI